LRRHSVPHNLVIADPDPLILNRIVLVADRPTDKPGVIACPPLIFLGALGAGIFLEWLMPVRLLPPEPALIGGATLCSAGIASGFWGSATMHLAGTNVRPDRPATVLVTRGPFRFSRNPLYLSLITFYLGITLLFNALWPLVMLAPVLAFVHRRIVLREEQYLEAKFGDEYRAYKTRVRRWL
jgi:protein-S-isoprenylcysteine O-methyltransferase Ste14